MDFNNDDKVDSIEYGNAQAYAYHVMDKNEDNRVSEEEAARAVKLKSFYYAVDDMESHYTVTGDADPETVFRPVWEIGKEDSSSREFALAPDRYREFLKRDFGWENRFYLIGHHVPENDFPYALPGASSTWGGTWGTSGWRTHVLNILFGVKEKPASAQWKLRVTLTGNDPEEATVFKVTLNGRSWKESIPKGKGALASPDKQRAVVMEFPVDHELVRAGGNEVDLTIVRGSWVTFDQVRLDCSEDVALVSPEKAYIRSVEPADYELSHDGNRVQPLLVHVEHLAATPRLSVLLNGRQIHTSIIEEGDYILEAPMPVVASPQTAAYEIQLDGKTIEAGTLMRSPQSLQTPADYVDTRMGTGHSRWMIAPGPWMPFGMVKLSPNNQNKGWQAGYEPTIENIGWPSPGIVDARKGVYDTTIP